jgi:hypothetical protein
MKMTKIELEQEELSTAVMDAVGIGRTLERQRIIALIAAIKDNWQKPSGFNYPTELFNLMTLISETADLSQTVRSADLYFGAKAERDRILTKFERQICFDALRDDDGRCGNHAGKCYEIRQAITELQGGSNA